MVNRIPKGRESDEITLRAVRMRAAGVTTPTIGRRLGLSTGNVVLRTNAVRDHDCDIPDPKATRAQIRRAYW